MASGGVFSGIDDILDIYRAKTPQDREALWDRLYEYEKSQRQPVPIPDRKALPSQVEKKTPKPEDFGAVPVTKPPRPEDFGATAVRGASGMSSKILSDIRTDIRTIRDVQKEAAGAAYEIGGKITDITKSPTAGYVANVIAETIPSLVGGQMGSKAAPLLEKGATALMQSALKPTLEQLRTGKAAKAIQTLLDEGINVSKGGIAKLKAKIAELNEQIAEAIKSSPATVDKAKVAGALQGTLDRFSKQVNPKSDLATIENAWTEFLTHPLLTGKQDIPVKLAQEMKQATYRELDKKYGELGSAAVESQKGLARGLKEGIAEAVPEIAGLNKKESELINALNVVERRALLEANKNPGGLAWLANNPKTWALYMADKSALFKSLAARLLKSQSASIPRTAGQVVGASVGAFEGQE